MTKTKLLTIAVLMMMITNCFILALVWKNNPLEHNHQQQLPVKDFLIKTLDLSPGQIKRFDVLRQQHRHTVDSLDEQVKSMKDRLFSQIGQQKNDTGLIDSLTRQIGNNTALINRTTFMHFKKLRGILTVAQQGSFDHIIQQVIRSMDHPGPPPNFQGPDENRKSPKPDPGGPDDHRPEGPPGGMNPGPPPGDRP
jgi:hypothetical protein